MQKTTNQRTVERQKFKRKYEQVARLASKFQKVSTEFQRMEDAFFDFGYSDTDDDEIIDTLGQGIGGLSFNDYLRKMKSYEENFERDGSFGIVF